MADKDKLVEVEIDIDDELLAKTKAAAKRQEMTVNEYIVHAMEMYVASMARRERWKAEQEAEE